mmetsp:Transcript_2024/g.3928  ORF Transcript_2024/g.3928 Transcript_2024/m.3928 type:complete len:245 (-) Transcript_2024:90-824(-)|eukprot:CAMPEP_0202703690 /NCGR_PEP_ID=MMETSP1385-20130828/16511_1 /ASSEMBLY_ACC=CAM_ASM_000861 /TAXON_ID=933848 /ORGANISM="Elphidium margaritaceum" /LENGTH=244 /DNA_ID=CAMNT_0049361589 /DNA_START=30 /DNA_END=764 /DNA_ORIENTATION=-
MTTAHKPTFHPAIGTANQGGYRYVVARQQKASRDLPGQLDLKLRQTGQNTQDDIAARDLKAELEAREAAYYDKLTLEKQRQGLLPEPDAIEASETKKALAITYENELAAFDDSDDSDSSEESDDDDDDADDSEDEEKALMAELAAIKKEKAIQKAKQEAEERRQKEAQEQNAMLTGNPLLNSNNKQSSEASKKPPPKNTFTLKRAWNEDTVFKNQAPEPKRQKRFINDTIRSDFHRKFMARYIK